MVIKMYQFSERLKKLRIERNMSQNELSKKMDLTRATINAWEMGINTPNAQSLVLLASFFKVSVDYLLGLDNRQKVDIEDLNQTEKKIVNDMVDYFCKIKEY